MGLANNLPAESAGLPIAQDSDVLPNRTVTDKVGADGELAPCSESAHEPQNGTEAAPLQLDQPSISQFRNFFELLDRLDRRASQETQGPAGASSTSSEVAKG